MTDQTQGATENSPAKLTRLAEMKRLGLVHILQLFFYLTIILFEKFIAVAQINSNKFYSPGHFGKHH